MHFAVVVWEQLKCTLILLIFLIMAHKHADISEMQRSTNPHGLWTFVFSHRCQHQVNNFNSLDPERWLCCTVVRPCFEIRAD